MLESTERMSREDTSRLLNLAMKFGQVRKSKSGNPIKNWGKVEEGGQVMSFEDAVADLEKQDQGRFALFFAVTKMRVKRFFVSVLKEAKKNAKAIRPWLRSSDLIIEVNPDSVQVYVMDEEDKVSLYSSADANRQDLAFLGIDLEEVYADFVR